MAHHIVNSHVKIRMIRKDNVSANIWAVLWSWINDNCINLAVHNNNIITTDSPKKDTVELVTDV